MSTKTNITPTKKPSTISLVSIALIYSITHNPVTNIVIIGTTMLILRTFAVKSGLNMDERTKVKNHIITPNVIANLIFIVKPFYITGCIFDLKII